jgi:hypothetical protein
MSKFVIFENRQEVLWAPTFATRAEAEAWLDGRDGDAFEGIVRVVHIA